MAKSKSNHTAQKQFLDGEEKQLQAIHQRFETEYLPCVAEEYKHLLPIFERLYLECIEYETYSVIEVAQKLGLDYQKIQKWAQDDEVLSHVLFLCRDNCLNNVDNALVCNYIDREKGVRYFIENSDDDTADREKYVQELKKIEQDKIDNAKKVFVMKQDIEKKEEAVVATDTRETLCSDETIQNYRNKKDLAEQGRSKEWLMREAETVRRWKFTTSPKHDPKTNTTTHTIEYKFYDDVEENDALREEFYNSTLCAATGSPIQAYAAQSFSLTLGACGESDEVSINALFRSLLSMKPADEYEGMLISRLLALHHQYMKYMAVAIQPSLKDEARERYINMATKLSRLHNETLEALNKYRRKGEQRVHVTHNHVNVNDGGKAILASEINQQAGGGAHDKK